MNIALLAVFATGLFLRDDVDPKVSNLGTLLVAGSVVAAATKGV